MASQKLTLKEEPTFEAEVEIPRVGRPAAVVMFTFVARPQDEFNALLKAEGDETTTKDRPDEELVMKLASGWDLDDPFTVENVRMLCNQFHGAGPAISRTYMKAYVKARLGN